MPHVQYNPGYNPFNTPSGTNTGRGNEDTLRHQPRVPVDWQQLYEQQTPSQEFQEQTLFQDDTATESEQLLQEKSPVHYQYKGRYIMTAVKSGLMIIDQHRADIRIRYERNLTLIGQKQAGTQRVLFPEVIQLSASDNVMMQQFFPDMTAMGFDLSDLGGGNYAINGVPAGSEGLDPVALVRHILTDSAEQGRGVNSELQSKLALSLARHTAIDYGQVLSNEEMEHIVNELFACKNVNYTPDGKAILCILPQHDIEQLLG